MKKIFYKGFSFQVVRTFLNVCIIEICAIGGTVIDDRFTDGTAFVSADISDVQEDGLNGWACNNF